MSSVLRQWLIWQYKIYFLFHLPYLLKWKGSVNMLHGIKYIICGTNLFIKNVFCFFRNLIKMYVGFAIRLTKQLGSNILPFVTSARIAYFLSFDWVTALQSNVDPTDREPTEVVVRYWFELPSCLWDTMTEPGWYLQILVAYIHKVSKLNKAKTKFCNWLW